LRVQRLKAFQRDPSDRTVRNRDEIGPAILYLLDSTGEGSLISRRAIHDDRANLELILQGRILADVFLFRKGVLRRYCSVPCGSEAIEGGDGHSGSVLIPLVNSS